MASWLPLLFQLIASQPVEPAANFAVRFDHKGCHFEYLDTFKGTYSHIGVRVPIRILLTSQQQRNLLRDILDAGFFKLPSKQLGTATTPSDVFELEVRNGQQRHRVAWTTTWVYQTEEGRPLRALHEAIFALIEKHPDVRRLPQRGDGCFGGPPAVR